MKITFLFTLAMLVAGPLLANGNLKEDVTSAAIALGNEANYSWHTTIDNGKNNARFRRGPTDGKTEKGGYTMLTMSFNDNPVQLVIQGTNAAVKSGDNGWQSAAEAAEDESNGQFNPALMVARQAQSYKTPALDAANLAGQMQNLTATTNGITGDLTEDGARGMLAFRRGNDSNALTISNAKGSVTFWLANGKLVKVQTHVSGAVSFNGNDRDIDRITTTEIKDVGTTKIEVPDDARKKLE